MTRPDIKSLVLSGKLTSLYQACVAQAQRIHEVSKQTESLLVTQAKHISQWSASEHLEHLMYTCRTTIMLIEEAMINPPAGPEDTPNELGTELFQKGEIPRGETSAPEFALPKGVKLAKIEKTFRRILSQLQDLQGRMPELESAQGRTKHPVLGHFSPKHWLSFMCIHQQHHLDIIEDILQAHKSSGTSPQISGSPA